MKHPYIPRLMEPLVLEVSKEYPAVLLVGPRQTGKTRMLQRLAEGTDRGYVSLDDLTNRALAKQDPAMFLQLHPAPVLIDEVQYAPELFSQIKMAADARRLKNGAEPFPASRGENAGSESGCDRNAAQEHDRVVRFEIGLRQFSPIDFHPVSFRRDGIPVRCEMQAVPPGEGRAGISGLPDKPVAEKQQNRGEKRKNRRDGARQRVCREEARDDERSNQEHE